MRIMRLGSDLTRACLGATRDDEIIAAADPVVLSLVSVVWSPNPGSVGTTMTATVNVTSSPTSTGLGMTVQIWRELGATASIYTPSTVNLDGWTQNSAWTGVGTPDPTYFTATFSKAFLATTNSLQFSWFIEFGVTSVTCSVSVFNAEGGSDGTDGHATVNP